MQYAYPFLPQTPSSNLASPTAFTTAITSYNEAYALMPTMAVGTGAAARIGDYIEPRKLTVDLRATLLSSRDVSGSFGNELWPEDIMVHIFFLKSKSIKDSRLAPNLDFSKLMGFDGHAAASFDGTNLNADKPINKEQFIVIKRLKFRLRRSAGFPSLVQYQGVAPVTGPPTLVPAVSYAGEDTKRFKVNIPCPKKLQFPEPGNIACENFFPFMVAGWTYTHAPLDQAVSNLSPLSIQATTQLYYTDD